MGLAVSVFGMVARVEVVLWDLPKEEELLLQDIKIPVVLELAPDIGYVLMHCPLQHQEYLKLLHMYFLMGIHSNYSQLLGDLCISKD